MRIRPSAGGGYTIPAGNLYPQGTAQTRPEVYAMGFRNPFRFSIDPANGWVYLADYGPDRNPPTTNRGPEGLVELNVIKAAGNYGWPFCHGDNQPYAPYNPSTGVVGAKFNCNAPVNNSPNNTGLTNLKPVVAPNMWYGYGTSPTFPELGSGGSGPMGGPVYRYDAANPSETKFPPYYDESVSWGGFIPFGIKPGLGLRYFFAGPIGLNIEIAAGTPVMCGGLSLRF